MADSSTENAAASVADPVVDAASATAPVVTAEPTPAKEPSSVLDAVTKALSPDKGVDAASPAAATGSTKEEPTPKDPASAGEPAELTEDELKHLAPKTQERMRFLAKERTDLQTQVQALKPKADDYEKLTGYLQKNRISSDEANNALELTRLIKAGDFVKAKELLDPIYAELQKRAGGVLDKDLQEEVRLGTTPLERAQELQKLRAVNASRATQEQIAEDSRRAEQQQQAWTTHVTTVARAADDWAKAKAGSDPDWEKKAPLVAEIVELDIRKNGFPKSAQEAIQRSDAALSEVNKRMAVFRPTPVEIRPNVGSGRASPSKDAKPKTALEAVNLALGG